MMESKVYQHINRVDTTNKRQCTCMLQWTCFHFESLEKSRSPQWTTNLPVGNLNQAKPIHLHGRLSTASIRMAWWVPRRVSQTMAGLTLQALKERVEKCGDGCFGVVKVISLGGSFSYFSSPIPALKEQAVEELLLNICSTHFFWKCWFSGGGRLGLLRSLDLDSIYVGWMICFKLQICGLHFCRRLPSETCTMRGILESLFDVLPFFSGFGTPALLPRVFMFWHPVRTNCSTFAKQIWWYDWPESIGMDHRQAWF